MRQLTPRYVASVDPYNVYGLAARQAKPDRPWLMINMISSTDGAIAVDGTSEALGNPADQLVFSAVRACADWILVAGGTVRVERYDLPRPGHRARQIRAATGGADRPGLAIVSGSLDLELDLPMFANQRADEDPPLILTGCDASPKAVKGLSNVAEIVKLPSPRPTPQEILTELGRREAQVVLCEGGPSFNAQMADAGMVDELCLSISPLIAGGASPRVVHGSKRTLPLQMELAHLLEADHTLFARYLVTPLPRKPAT